MAWPGNANWKALWKHKVWMCAPSLDSTLSHRGGSEPQPLSGGEVHQQSGKFNLEVLIQRYWQIY
jgi:hypothetical protein